ncbi:MAG TPA: tetratricopeptide repeat protein, partial [Acetobacteraceae bacterium]|nr:tetratricopeptide repeat protein [Acetobacteraceae bacterium]
MPDATSRVQRGLQHHRSGRLDEAERLYADALTENPRDADALHLLGVLADARGARVRAVALIIEALKLRDAAQFHCNLSMVLGKLDRNEEAVAAASRALTLRSDYPQALNNLGVALEALGRLEQAEAALRRALSAKPDYADAWSNLGNTLRRLDRPEEAIAAYERAVVLNPAFPGAYANKAHLLREQGRLSEAEAAYRNEVAWHPDDPAAHTNLAAVLSESARSGDLEPESHNTLGNTLQRLGRFEEAEAACRRALALRPDYADAAINLGNVLREQGRLK